MLTTNTVSIPHGDLQIQAYLAHTDTPGTYPAIIVVQEIFGVNDHIRAVTRRIAQEGYVAIAPAIYQRQAPDFAVGYTPQDIEIGRVYKNRTQAAELLGDIQATIDYLYTLPQVKKTGVGTIGFCFGGHVVYLVSTLDSIKVTASFYGAGITTMTPGGGEPTVTCTPEIKGTLYAFFGEADQSIPLTQVEAIRTALVEARIPHQIFCYPEADHGFFCDQRASYHPSAAQDAWQHVLELFSKLN
jgi:carboxymethylenebutenolidase